MARINIEDSLFKDDRFLNLIEKTGNRYIAIGMVVSAFILSQKHWLKYKCIPNSDWPEQLNILVHVGLAVVENDGVYIKGSRENFIWLERQSNAGKSRSEKKLKGLEAARNKKAESLNHGRTSVEPGLKLSKALTPTLSLSHSLSLEEEQNSKKDTATEIVTEINNSSIKNYSHWFEKFVYETLGTSDTRKALLSLKVEKAFGTEEAFLSWVDNVCGAKKFKESKTTKQKERYFDASLASELKARSVL